MDDLKPCVDFLRRLVRTESLPGREEKIANVVRAEMDTLGYTETHLDTAGNVIGRIPGRGDAPPMMFNTHLDHVDVGDPDAWPHPPYGGEVHDDRVWGRGAVDIKGPLAAQVYGVARLAGAGSPPPGDVYVTATVQEEVGGLGARHLVQHLTTPLVVVGEPSRGELRRGHRGRVELELHAVGRSVHASVPDQGINALELVASFIRGLRDLEMASHPDLGSSTVVPSLIRIDQTSPNVVPGEAWLTCDWRMVPGETAEDARRKLQAVADAALVPGARVEVTLPTYRRVSFTGLGMEIAADNPAYIVDADHPVIPRARQVLATALGREVPVGTWRFATDGGHFSEAGMTCIGFGPGDDLLAHTVDEHISIADLAAGLDGNEALARHLDARSVTAT